MKLAPVPGRAGAARRLWDEEKATRRRGLRFWWIELGLDAARAGKLT